MSTYDLGQRAQIPLSAPHQSGAELAAVARVLESNWLASVGPEVTAFESEAAAALGVGAASDSNAVTSGPTEASQLLSRTRATAASSAPD